MATLDDIKKQKQQENDRYKRAINNLDQQKATEKSRHQRQIEYLNAEIERIKQQNKQLESYNKLLEFVIQE